MTDPTFKDRAGLEAWRGRKWHAQALAFAAGRERSARSLGNKVRRVVAAHAHLVEETPHGRD